MKKIISIIILAVLILAVYLYKTKPQSQKTLNIADKITVNIFVSDSPTTRAKGFSNHPGINYKQGMLFVFDKPAIYSFWMKDMLFDLDFIMIRENKVVYLEKNIKAPINNNQIIRHVISNEPFNQLLEIKAGFIDKYKIELGDQVSF